MILDSVYINLLVLVSQSLALPFSLIHYKPFLIVQWVCIYKLIAHCTLYQLVLMFRRASQAWPRLAGRGSRPRLHRRALSLPVPASTPRLHRYHYLGCITAYLRCLNSHSSRQRGQRGRLCRIIRFLLLLS